jgi:hypothetical protein
MSIVQFLSIKASRSVSVSLETKESIPRRECVPERNAMYLDREMSTLMCCENEPFSICLYVCVSVCIIRKIVVRPCIYTCM